MKMILAFGYLLFSLSCQAQEINYEFVKHLYQNGLWRESLIYSNNIQNDTLLFWTAKTLFKSRKYDSAQIFFARVSNRDACLYFEAKSWSNFMSLAEGKNSLLFWPSGCMESQRAIKEKMLTYNKLLVNDLNIFLDYSDPNVEALIEERKTFKPKSVALAAGLSALLPGLGKMYTQNPNEGLAAFFQCSFLALQAAEAYRLNPRVERNERFWFFGGMFFVFYAGNIWGSATKVKVNRREFYEQQNRKILEFMYYDLEQHFRGSN